MTLSKDLKARVADAYSQGGITMREVAEMFGISLGLVHKVVACNERFGQGTHPYSPGPPGRRRTLNGIDTLFIREAIEAEPTTHLNELRHKLAIARDVHVSTATISHTLSRMGLTRKVLSRYAIERSESIRVLWEMQMAQYSDPDLFVFLDESAVDGRTGLRANGWAPSNIRAVERSTILRGVRHSILPALTSRGMIALEIFEGSVTKDCFLRFLRENIVSPVIGFTTSCTHQK
jgi:transposase